VVGIFIAQAFLRGNLSTKSAVLPITFCMLGLGSLIVAANVDLSNSIRAIYWGIPATLIVLGAVMLENTGKLPKFRILHLLGDASYSIYLAHIYSLGILGIIWSKLITPEPTLVQITSFVLTGLVVSSICGIVLHFIIEKPLTRYLRNHIANS